MEKNELKVSAFYMKEPFRCLDSFMLCCACQGMAVIKPLWTKVLLAFLVFICAAPAFGADNASLSGKEKILNQIEKKYSGKDFSASFYQISCLKAIEMTEEAYGRAFFSYPGKMRWEYQKPEKNQIITDGSSLWIYRPDENQVVKGNAGSFFKAGAGGAFLSDFSIVREKYDISLTKQEDRTAELKLVPEQKDPEIKEIMICIDQESVEIRTVVTTNIYGDTTTLKFSNIQFRPLEASLFEFIVPEGTDILYMNDSDPQALK